jgi:hypothetical protein
MNSLSKFWYRFNQRLKCISCAGLSYTMKKCSQGRYPYSTMVVLSKEVPLFLLPNTRVFN